MDDPFVEIMGPLGVLRQRTVEVFARHGLKVEHFAVAPGAATEGPHEVHVVASLADNNEVPDDPEFGRVMREAQDADIESKSQEALSNLRQRLANPGGFLE